MLWIALAGFRVRPSREPHPWDRLPHEQGGAGWGSVGLGVREIVGVERSGATLLDPGDEEDGDDGEADGRHFPVALFFQFICYFLAFIEAV